MADRTRHSIMSRISSLSPLLLFGGAAALLYSSSGVAAGLDSLQAIQSFLERHSILAPLLFLLAYSLAVPLLLPGSLLCLLGGALFGPWLGAVLNVTGATLGAVVALLIARHLAEDLVTRHIGERLQRFKLGVEQQSWRFVALVRLVPVIPYDLSNYAFGLTRIPLTQFSAATAVCLLPRLAVYAYIGHSGMSLVSEEGDRLMTLVGMATLLFAALLLPYLYARVRLSLKQQP